MQIKILFAIIVKHGPPLRLYRAVVFIVSMPGEANKAK